MSRNFAVGIIFVNVNIAKKFQLSGASRTMAPSFGVCCEAVGKAVREGWEVPTW